MRGGGIPLFSIANNQVCVIISFELLLMYIVILKFVYIPVYIPCIVKQEIKRNVLIYNFGIIKQVIFRVGHHC